MYRENSRAAVPRHVIDEQARMRRLELEEAERSFLRTLAKCLLARAPRRRGDHEQNAGQASD